MASWLIKFRVNPIVEIKNNHYYYSFSVHRGWRGHALMWPAENLGSLCVLSSADCQPPCLNRGSCSRPHTCVCRSGFQGPRCEEVALEQVYIRERGTLRRVEPGTNPFQRDQKRPAERESSDTGKAQTLRPETTKPPVQTAWVFLLRPERSFELYQTSQLSSGVKSLILFK